jgi:hypothetical protein
MTEIKFDIKRTELRRELLTEGFTNKIDCVNYWDSHGMKIEYAPTQHKFDREKKFEIYKVTTEIEYPYSGKYVSEDWEIHVEGKKLSVGELMGYRILKTKLKLTCCIGAG